MTGSTYFNIVTCTVQRLRVYRVPTDLESAHSTNVVKPVADFAEILVPYWEAGILDALAMSQSHRQLSI